MDALCFPYERVLEINAQILLSEAGMKGAPDIAKLQGALGRIDNAIMYNGLDDVFEIAAFYAECISKAHSLSDANKRTGLAVALEYLSLNDYEITVDNEHIANAMVDLVQDVINRQYFADILYSQYVLSQESKPEFT
jgi:death on curing protein